MCHGDERELDEDYVLVHNHLSHYSTQDIDVSSMKTGYSKELSGEVIFWVEILIWKFERGNVYSKKESFSIHDGSIMKKQSHGSVL